MTAGLTHLCRSALVAAGLAITFATAICSPHGINPRRSERLRRTGVQCRRPERQRRDQLRSERPRESIHVTCRRSTDRTKVSEPGWNG